MHRLCEALRSLHGIAAIVGRCSLYPEELWKGLGFIDAVADLCYYLYNTNLLPSDTMRVVL